jgi:hypothetical protein
MLTPNEVEAIINRITLPSPSISLWDICSDLQDVAVTLNTLADALREAVKKLRFIATFTDVNLYTGATESSPEADEAIEALKYIESKVPREWLDGSETNG